jgi:coniferyl-aldehyde dehydrogenase
MFNAGQVCLNVDYLFLPEGRVDAFVEHAKRGRRALPGHQWPRLHLDHRRGFAPAPHRRTRGRTREGRDAGQPGTQTPDPALRKLAPQLVLGVSDDMELMQREIFGPILPIKTYRDPEEVVRYVNSHERPLAIYPFTHDRALQQLYIDRVMSGGVSVNEAMMHAAQHDMPFGGVGGSGSGSSMGHYHGYEGFTTFSKLRPVFHQAPFSAIQMMFQPPYGARAAKIMDWLIKLRG